MHYRNYLAKTKHVIQSYTNKFLSCFYKAIKDPVFIIGNQKSGTTIISKLLSQATGEKLTCDFQRAINHSTLQLELDFKLLDFPKFIQDYNYEFSKKIIKEPFLTYYINDLKYQFPKAKFILIIRNPFDNIRSILNRLNIPGNIDKFNFNEYSEIIKTPVWKLAMQTNMLGITSSNYIEAMANRWNYIVNSYYQNSERIILIKYEDFIKDKKNCIDILAKKVNLKVKYDISKKVNIQYQKKGDRSINLVNFFGEENYSKIETICKLNIEKIGY